ncbi:MAG: carboxyltransferase domain-containing protein [Pseudomonadota bacterium]
MEQFPQIRLMGLTGVLIRFAERLSEPANRAALAFRSAAEAQNWDGVCETSTSLASVYLRIDPIAVDPDLVAQKAQSLATSRDWTTEPLPAGRRHWRIPCTWGGKRAPGLSEVAAMAGASETEAIAEFSAASLRVLTLGFAPGQPYLGQLAPRWEIPRQSQLTPMVPAGAVLLAVRQFVLFTAPSPTGWRHVGQTAISLFRPDDPTPVALRPGDEITFHSVPEARMHEILAAGEPDGGAVQEDLT